ncbi:MAG: hypothetical protein AAGA75_12455 [Cyanobacteria bacterium P01_E01_bin.6]
MKYVADQLLGAKLKRDRRLRHVLKLRVQWWEYLFLMLTAFVVLWFGLNTNIDMFYVLMGIVISGLSLQVRKLQHRVDALTEVLSDAIEAQLAEKLKD